jgi:hypothetical protein
MKPGATYVDSFTVHSATGALVDGDSTPTAAAYKNGAVDSGITVTVTKISTGSYVATATVGSGYVSGDKISAFATCAVSGVTVGQWLKTVEIDSSFVSDAVAGFSTVDVKTIGGVTPTIIDDLSTQESVDDLSDQVTAMQADVDGLATSTALTGVSGQVTAMQADVDALATATALSAVSGLVTAVKAVTDVLTTMIESSGGHNRYKATALETVSVDLTSIETTITKLEGMIEAGDGAYNRFKETALEEGGGGSIGPGSVPYTYGPLYYTGTTTPVDGAEVVFYTDQACATTPIDRKWTNAQGTFATALDPGTYWLTRSHSQVSFAVNPISITVEAPA